MSSTAPPKIRVLVQLPYDRPEEPLPNPPHIEWNADKANILWEVIALSRTSDNGGTDWKGLAAHLQVPLPYLLYRAQARYEQDLRGLQDIRGELSTPFPAGPSTPTDPSPRPVDVSPTISSAHPLSIRIPPARLTGAASIGARRLSASQRMATPLGVRARLNSLTHKSPSKPRGGPGKTSSSTATLQGAKRTAGPLSAPPRTASRLSDDAESESSDDDDDDDDDDEERKEEEKEREAEEQEHRDKKLERLQKMMTSERLGLVKSPLSPLSPDKGKGREIVRGRPPFPASTVAVEAIPGSPRNPTLNEPTGLDLRLAEFTSAPRNRDHSASVSSASSHRGSIPSIPSPRGPSPSPSPPPVPHRISSPHDHSRFARQQAQALSRLHPSSQAPSTASSPLQRNLSPAKSGSPPTVSARNARSHAHTRQGFGALGAATSEGESNHGSSASSFSDLSDASLSGSALESSLMSNARGTTSRFNSFAAVAKSRPGGRGGRQ